VLSCVLRSERRTDLLRPAGLWRNAVQPGMLGLLSFAPGARPIPIAPVGSAGIGYYDYYGWSGQTDWHQAGTGARP